MKNKVIDFKKKKKEKLLNGYESLEHIISAIIKQEFDIGIRPENMNLISRYDKEASDGD